MNPQTKSFLLSITAFLFVTVSVGMAQITEAHLPMIRWVTPEGKSFDPDLEFEIMVHSEDYRKMRELEKQRGLRARFFRGTRESLMEAPRVAGCYVYETYIHTHVCFNGGLNLRYVFRTHREHFLDPLSDGGYQEDSWLVVFETADVLDTRLVSIAEDAVVEYFKRGFAFRLQVPEDLRPSSWDASPAGGLVNKISSLLFPSAAASTREEKTETWDHVLEYRARKQDSFYNELRTEIPNQVASRNCIVRFAQDVAVMEPCGRGRSYRTNIGAVEAGAEMSTRQ